MKIPERQSISKMFKILDNEMEITLFYLAAVRNFCAHGNRLYCYRTKNPINDTHYHNKMKITQAKNEYVQGKRNLFATLIALKVMLSNNNFNHFIKELNDQINNLSTHLHILKKEEILNEMGFPDNWLDIKAI